MKSDGSTPLTPDKRNNAVAVVVKQQKKKDFKPENQLVSTNTGSSNHCVSFS